MSILDAYLVHTLTLIEYVTTTADKYGVPQYANLATNVKAKVEKTNERVLTESGEEVAATLKIFIGTDNTIQPKYRVTWDSVIYEVIVVQPFTALNSVEFYVLYCVESV